MSNFAVDGSLITEDGVRLTDNTATTLYTAPTNQPISSIIVAATTGTPTITLTLTNQAGSTTRTLWKAAAPFIFTELVTMPTGYVLKAQSSSASGDADVFVTHGAPAAARSRV